MLSENKEIKDKINIIAFGYIFLIDLYMIMLQAQVSGLDYNLQSIRLFLLFIIIIISIIYLVFNFFRTRQTKLFISILFFLLYIQITNVFISNEPLVIQSVFNVTFGPLIFLSSLTIFRLINIKTFKMIVGFKVVFFIVSASLFLACYFLLGSRNGVFINSIFYTISLIPFLMISKKPKLSILLISVVLFLALLVGKRTAFLLSLIYLAFWTYKNFGYRLTSTVKIFSLFSIFILLSSFVLIFMDPSTFIGIERLGLIFSDGGSGRNKLISYFLADFFSTPIFNHFFGHGAINAIQLGVLELSAHNDFIEIYYRLGFFGLVLYFICGVQLFKLKSVIGLFSLEDKSIFSITILIYVLLSFVSMLIFVPSYATQFFIFFALIHCKYMRLNKISLLKLNNESISK